MDFLKNALGTVTGAINSATSYLGTQGVNLLKNVGSSVYGALTKPVNNTNLFSANITDLINQPKNSGASGSFSLNTQPASPSIQDIVSSYRPTTNLNTSNSTPVVRNISPGLNLTPTEPQPTITPTINQPTQPFSGGSFSVQTPTSIRGGDGLITKEIQSYDTRALNPYASSGSSSASIGNQSASTNPNNSLGANVFGGSINQGTLIVDQQEEQRRKQQLGTPGYQNTGRVLSEQQLNQMFNTQSGTPLQIGGGAYKFAGREYIPQRNADGSTTFVERAGQSGVGGSLSQTNIPTSGGAVDLSKLTSRVGEISGVLDLIKQGKVPNAQEALSMFQRELEGSLQQIQTQNPLPPTPVVDTPEQQNFLNMLEPTQQLSVRQQMDEARVRLNLPNLESQRLNAMQQIQALNESFKKITDEIKNNPDLPKSLAQKQIQEFAKTSQGLLDSYNSQLQILSQQISDANQALNQEFKIIETEDSIRRQAIEDNRAILKSLIDTGAIGEYDNAQVGELAQATGYSVASLKALQKAVKTKADQYTNIQYITDDKGNVTVVGINEAGQPVKLGALGSIGKADKVTTTGTSLGTVAQQTVAEYAARIEQAEPTISSLQNSIKDMNVLSFEAQLKLPAALQSDVIQQYQQAARNFINAKLRRESGAVISPTEFSEARQQYLPQPGDSDSVLNLKKQNRDLVFASLKKASGPAFSSVADLLGNQSINPNQMIQVSITDPKTGVTKTGTLSQADIADAKAKGYIVK